MGKCGHCAWVGGCRGERLATIKLDDEVTGPVNRENCDRFLGLTIRYKGTQATSQGSDGGDPGGLFAGQTMGHERTIGMSKEIDATWIDRIALNDLPNQIPQVRDIINLGAGKITATFARVPKSGACSREHACTDRWRAVRRREDVAFSESRLRKTQVTILGISISVKAMQENKEWIELALGLEIKWGFDFNGTSATDEALHVNRR